MARKDRLSRVEDEVIENEKTEAEKAEAPEEVAHEAEKSQQISQKIDGQNVITTVSGGQTFAVGLGDLPADIVTRLAVFGLMKKLGSQGACAGKKSVAEREAAISKVIDSLKEGKWIIKGTGEKKQKVSMDQIKESFLKLPPEAQANAAVMLAGMGINADTIAAWQKPV